MVELGNSKLTLSLTLRLNPRLGGYSIWNVNTYRTPHAHKILKNIKTTRAGAPHGLDARFEGRTQRLVTTQP